MSNANVCLQMADEQQERASDGDKNKEGSTLASFITDQYAQQKEAGKMDSTEELSDERTTNFFNRALSESNRMNKEIAKSKQKLSKLQEEFGSEMIDAWRTEHASQVLTVEKAAAVERAENGAFC